MTGTQDSPSGPDLAQGLALDKIADGAMLAGRVGDDAVLIARRGEEIFAIGAACTHYSGPLAEGFLVGETVRCPWHHACFSLRTGEAVRAPALDPRRRAGASNSGATRSSCARRSEDEAAPARPKSAAHPDRIVIVGGGAAGFAAAEMLRREGFGGAITMLSADEAPPCDRPNLSKDYLAGSAPEEWIPLRDEAFYREQDIDLHLGGA